MDNPVAWTSLWTSTEEGNNNKGWVTHFEDADQIRKCFEIGQSLSFVCRRKTSNFGKSGLQQHSGSSKNLRVRFHDIEDAVVPYDGVPFCLIGKYELNCMFGKDQHKAQKNKQQATRDSELKRDHPRGRKSKRMLQTTKKRGCPARILMKHVVRFSDFKINSDTKRSKRKGSEDVRDAVDRGLFVNKESRIYISLPANEAHKGTHYLGELTGLMNPLSREVRSKIVDLVGKGVTNVKEMKRHIRMFVETSLSGCGNAPSTTDAAYYPTDETIRKHVYMAQQKLRYSRLDIDNFAMQTKEWAKNKPEDNFRFVPPILSSDENEADSQFFFCHQTKYQRHLLRRYGNTLCLLDATYRTTKYSLPLFFLAVKTNVGFSVVAQFIVQEETTEAIKCGLATVREWMLPEEENGTNVWTWKPKYFMTDFSEREIKAIEETFPECETYLCDFHREQSWTRWVSKHDNGVANMKENVLAMLRRCAHANTIAEYNNAIFKLKNSTEWRKSSRLRNWFSKVWIPEAKRWVWAYRHGKGLQVNTNNGLERQNKVFKYSFLENKKNSSLSSMVDTLLNEYLPSMMLKYIKDNTDFSEGLGRLFNKDIPKYLRNRPPDFVKSCLNKKDLGEAIPVCDIVRVSSDTFKIQSQSNNDTYTMCLDVGNGLPGCDCHSWTWTHLPCKHMFAVMHYFDDISWDSLPKDYTESPLFTLDGTITLVGERQRSQDEEAEVIASQQQCTADLPPRKRRHISPIKSTAVVCREQLSTIERSTYLCQNIDALKHLSSLLKEANQFINLHLNSEDGVPVRPEVSMPKKKKISRSHHPTGKPLKSIPKRKLPLRRSKFHASGRFGASADKAKERVYVTSSSKDTIMDEVIVDGCAEVPGQQAANLLKVLDKARAFRDSLEPKQWSTFVGEAEISKRWTADVVSLTAMSVLDEFSDDEQMQLLISLFALAPEHLGNSAKYRLATLLIAELVKNGDIYTKFDAEQRSKEAEQAMQDLLKATAAMCNVKATKHVTFWDGTCPGQDEQKKNFEKQATENRADSFSRDACFGKNESTSKFDLRDIVLKLQPANEITKVKVTNGSRVHVCGEVLEKADLTSLRGNNWLTDKVINAYLALLKSNANKQHDDHIYVLPSYVAVLWDNGRFDTFLYKKVKLSMYKWVFMPVNVNGNHWILLAGNVSKQTVTLLDSLNLTSSKIYLEKWKKFMSMRAKQVDELGKWTVDDSFSSAQQKDGHSCGAFVMLNALALTIGKEGELSSLTSDLPALMRTFVLRELIHAAVKPPSQRTKCDMIGCPSFSKQQMWVRCDVCGRWSHFSCVAITHKPKAEFICPICIAQYE